MRPASVVLALAVTVSACGGGGREAPAADSLQVLRAGASTGVSSARHWSTLRDVLPNVTYVHEGTESSSREQVTDSVVVGRVVRTEEALGMLPEPLVSGEDVHTRVVPYDDPRAAWRVLSVTVDVTETLAGDPAEELVLDWVVLGSAQQGPDAPAVGQALRDLGDLVVLSKAAPNRSEFLPGRGPLPSGYGIGRVAADGRLDFPLIAAAEGLPGAAFQDGIDTLAELRQEARKPPRTQAVVLEQGP